MPKFTPEELQRAHDAGMATLTKKMDAAGVDEEFLIKKLRDELDAKEAKAFQSQGEVVYSKPMIDWGTRQRARIDAQKLRGLYPAEKHEVEFDYLGALARAKAKQGSK